MDNSNKVERSEIWKKIYEILGELNLKEVEGDCLDRASAAIEIEQAIKQIIPDNEIFREIESTIEEINQNFGLDLVTQSELSVKYQMDSNDFNALAQDLMLNRMAFYRLELLINKLKNN